MTKIEVGQQGRSSSQTEGEDSQWELTDYTSGQGDDAVTRDEMNAILHDMGVTGEDITEFITFFEEHNDGQFVNVDGALEVPIEEFIEIIELLYDDENDDALTQPEMVNAVNVLTWDTNDYSDIQATGDSATFEENEIKTMLLEYGMTSGEAEETINYIGALDDGKYLNSEGKIEISVEDFNALIETMDGDDTNNDGDITYQEMQSFEDKIMLSREEFDHLLTEKYSNITDEEKTSILNSFFAGGQSNVSENEIFSVLDIDNSGKISTEEMIDAPKRIAFATEEDTILRMSGQQDDVCWYHAGLHTISNSVEGEEIIDRAVDKLPNGGYRVTFPADPDKNYIISAEEMRKTELSYEGDTFELSDGADPVLKALEIAGYRYSKDNPDKFGDDQFARGNPSNVVDMFNIKHKTTTFETSSDVVDFFMNYPDGEPINLSMGYMLSGIRKPDRDGYLDKIGMRDGPENHDAGGHMVTITAINNDGTPPTVTILDSSDPTVERIVPIHDLAERDVANVIDMDV